MGARLTCLVLLAACNGGGESSPSETPSAPTETQREIETLATRAFEGHWWVVTEKTCGDQTLTLAASPERWRFDPNFAARQTVSEDNEARLCRLIETYERAATRREASGQAPDQLTYFEEAGLAGRHLKTACQTKINGTPIDPPLPATIVESNAAPVEMRIGMLGAELRLEIKGSPECLGTLDLRLQAAQ